MLLGLCVNARSLQLECARVLHETLLGKVRIMATQMVNFRGFLSIRRMDKVSNSGIRELCGVTKGLMKVFSDGLAKQREWRMIGLVRESRV